MRRVLLVAAVVLLGAPTASRAASACSYDSATQTITITGADGGGFRVSGDTLLVNLDTHYAACGNATLSNTHTVSIEQGGEGWIFDEQRGALEQHTASSLRFVFDAATTITVYGAPGPDAITAATSGVDLDGDGVLDITTPLGASFSAAVFGEAGRDTIRTAGYANGGPGADTLYGRFVDGGAGADTIYGLGSAGRTILSGGGGDDVIYAARKASNTIKGGGGDDTIQARQGQADTIDGGPGVDTAWLDPGLDQASFVEHVH